MSTRVNFEGKPFNIEKLISNINKTIEKIYIAWILLLLEINCKGFLCKSLINSYCTRRWILISTFVLFSIF